MNLNSPKNFDTTSKHASHLTASFCFISAMRPLLSSIQKSLGRLTLGSFDALRNIGAISHTLQHPPPHPIGVTRKCNSGCSIAYLVKVSTDLRIAFNPIVPPIVGIAYDCPCRPSRCPITAPKCFNAKFDAPSKCLPELRHPKTKISLSFNVVTHSGEIRLFVSINSPIVSLMHQQPNENMLQLYHLPGLHIAIVFHTYPSRFPHNESMSSHDPSRLF